MSCAIYWRYCLFCWIERENRYQGVGEMLQEANTKVEGKGIIKGAVDVAEKAAKTAYDIEKMKIAATQAVEEGVSKAKRMIKKGRYAAEDLVEDTAHHIKREPFRSVGIMFGTGLGLGILAGCLITYRSMKVRSCDQEN